MDDINGKVALITGGASGIGLATARSLARAGAKLVLADIEAKALDEAVSTLASQGAEVIGVRTDVGDRASVEAVADAAERAFGGIHILFNNAGVGVSGPMQDMSQADWEWTLRVNLWGPIHGVSVVVPRMIAQGQGGHVLFTASFAGLVANRELGPYCVSKAAVVSMAECLAKDVKSHGIGVSVLCPMRVESRIDQAYRNRPTEFGGPREAASYAEREDITLEGRTLGADVVGDMVVSAIRRNELYIITHKETASFVLRRFERLQGALAQAL